MTDEPKLPPLPLKGGALFVDNSMLETLAKCPREAQYSKLNQRVSSSDKAALNFGTAIHLALEYRYKVYKNQAPDIYYDQAVAELLQKHFEAHPQPVDDWRTLNWALTVLKQYNEKYSIETFNLLQDEKGEPLVEMPFALPLYTARYMPPGETKGLVIPIIYTGRIDLPVMRDGQPFILDHKTAGMLGPSYWEQARMSSQGKGYCWSFEQLTGQKVTGFGLNVIRSKEPPLYITQGKAARDGKVVSPAKWWDESLQREWFYLKEGDLEEWKRNAISLVELFFYFYSQQYFPLFAPKPCTMYRKCQFFEVCTCAVNERGTMLSSGLYTDNNWSPLKQVENNESTTKIDGVASSVPS